MIDVLIVKTSSLGDVIHALPVLSDLQRIFPDWKVAWMVEENFQDLPRLHPFCSEVISVAVRRWRKTGFSSASRKEISELRGQLHTIQPRYVLDLQGLIKSALLAKLSPGCHVGYSWGSARENLATLTYDKTYPVSWNQHAVERNRKLAALALGYALDDLECDYGLSTAQSKSGSKKMMMIHSTSKESKLWPEQYWIELGVALQKKGYESILPSGSKEEWQRAQRLAQHIPHATALPPGPLKDFIVELQPLSMVVGVDTGLTHLSTAMGLPTVAIYTATDPSATGVYGSRFALNLGGKQRTPLVEEVMLGLDQVMHLGAN